jgi:hypothetical protein
LLALDVDYEVHHMDIKIVFLSAYLEEKITWSNLKDLSKVEKIIKCINYIIVCMDSNKVLTHGMIG